MAAVAADFLRSSIDKWFRIIELFKLEKTSKTESSCKLFPISGLNLPWHNLRLFPLDLSFVIWEKRLTPICLHPLFR